MDDKLESMKYKIRNRIDLTKEPTDEEIKNIIEEVIKERATEAYISIDERTKMSQSLFNSIRRLDIIQPLLEDGDITEIMINGQNNIFVEKNGNIKRINSSFNSKQRLEDVIQQIVSKVNRIVNESSPIVDARLIDGSRINVVLPPIALNGPIVTIRKFPLEPIAIKDLLKWGTLTEEVGTFLEKLVISKYNIFICGSTGSGKTTFLNVLSNFIPKDERIITIEDSAELQIHSVENIVKLETRNANIEGKKEISIRELIKTSLRMRPDRIIVGEVRGTEAIDMLQAMNTGHDGSLSTGHANSTKDMLTRLETMILTGGNIPLEAIRQQISSAIDIIIHLGRLRDKSRKILDITEVIGFKDGHIQLNPIYKFVEKGESEEKNILGEFQFINALQNRDKLSKAGLEGVDHVGKA